MAARDPSTELGVLATLVEPYCHDFLLNPMVPLLPILHGVEFFHSLMYGASQRLATHWLTPSFVLGALPFHQFFIAAHPRCPAERLPGLLYELGGGVQPDRDLVLGELTRAVARAIPSPIQSRKALLEVGGEAARGAVREALLRLASHQAEGTAQSYVAGHPLTPVEVLESLADDPTPRVRAVLSTNASTPTEILLDSIRRDDARAMVAMALDPALRPQAAEALTSCGRVHVRAVLAEHPSLDLDLLEALARDRSWLVRRAVAWNVSAPPDVLARLASDSRREVRAEVRWRAALVAA